MQETLNISNYEFWSNYLISKVYYIGCIDIGIGKFKFLSKTRTPLKLNLIKIYVSTIYHEMKLFNLSLS